MEHILIFTLIGLAFVGVFIGAAGLMGTSLSTAARASIPAWLAAAAGNAAYGVLGAGIPILNEIGAFVPIFGVPAVFALVLSRMLKA
jgi:hypothetical protein